MINSLLKFSKKQLKHSGKNLMKKKKKYLFKIKKATIKNILEIYSKMKKIIKNKSVKDRIKKAFSIKLRAAKLNKSKIKDHQHSICILKPIRIQNQMTAMTQMIKKVNYLSIKLKISLAKSRNTSRSFLNQMMAVILLHKIFHNKFKKA